MGIAINATRSAPCLAGYDVAVTWNGSANGSKYAAVNGDGWIVIYGLTSSYELTRYIWPATRLAINDAHAGLATDDANVGPATDDANVGPATDADAGPTTWYDPATKRYKCCQQRNSRCSSTDHGLPWRHLATSQ